MRLICPPMHNHAEQVKEDRVGEHGALDRVSRSVVLGTW